MSVLSELKPKLVMRYFEEISAMPHGSGNTDAIADYCVRFASGRNLECARDASNNVIIIKQASRGYEDVPAIIVQGHLDMVCEKEPGCEIDMEHEGIQLATDGEWIWAKGTTLGGDNGIAVAMALALLDREDIPHPRLEVVLTSNEEIGLIGASALNTDVLRGRMMLNVDSENEGILTVSCSGGVRANCRIPVQWEEITGCVCHINISGLTGGHSGIKIVDGGANANILMGRLLYGLQKEMSIRITQLSGGMADNAISASCEAKVLVPQEEMQRLRQIVASYGQTYYDEFSSTDPEIRIECISEWVSEQAALTAEATHRVASALMLFPNGVQTMSHHIPGLVQTSLNLGVLRLCNENMIASFSVRSSAATEKAHLCNRLESLSEAFGGHTDFAGDYPGWAYKPDSKLRDLVADVFEKNSGKKAVIEAIHAGLECGIFAGKLPGLDCVSIGPDMENIHSPAERLNVASVERTWNLICEVLKRTKEL